MYLHQLHPQCDISRPSSSANGTPSARTWCPALPCPTLCSGRSTGDYNQICQHDHSFQHIPPGEADTGKPLNTVQQVIHEKNPFVREFKQILNLPEEELQGGIVVIRAAARPQQGHARVYNAQINLQELSIVTNEQPHDLVVQLHGGGLRFISDLNPKAMLLHFTLLFITGYQVGTRI